MHLNTIVKNTEITKYWKILIEKYSKLAGGIGHRFARLLVWKV